MILDKSGLCALDVFYDLGLDRKAFCRGYDCKIKKLKSLPVLSYFTFCNVLYIWACPGHPYL